MIYEIDGESLDPATLIKLACSPDKKINVPVPTLRNMARSREVLDGLIAAGATIYGVNTNMGGMVKWLIPPDKAGAVQHNLINAVATNVGPYLDTRVVRAAMLCRINSLAKGRSAISIPVFESLIAMYNKNVVPCVPSLGSLGTSGDLGPLAAVALVVTGQGLAEFDGDILPGKVALDRAGIRPVTLSYKDGLALINGTSFMTALLAFALSDAQALMNNYLAITTLSFGVLGAKAKPITPRVHEFKGHCGQYRISQTLYSMLSAMPGVVSEVDVSRHLASQRTDCVTEGSHAVEDSYSLRCTPQILGPVFDNIEQIRKWVAYEINSANDNPLIDSDAGEVYHCGHFHGQYISMAADHLKIAISTLANLADRRIDRLLDSKKNGRLPPFLAVNDAGSRLGLMGVQFMSSSLTAEIRTNATPVSIQSLSTTADFQDIISLGLVAARQAYEVVQKCAYVLGAELFLGCQSVDQQALSDLPEPVKSLYTQLRKKYPYIDADRHLTAELEFSKEIVLKPHPGIWEVKAHA